MIKIHDINKDSIESWKDFARQSGLFIFRFLLFEERMKWAKWIMETLYTTNQIIQICKDENTNEMNKMCFGGCSKDNTFIERLISEIQE